MKKFFIFILVLIMSFSLLLGKIYTPKKGYFINDISNKCWYRTTYLGSSNKYFGMGTDVYVHALTSLNMTNNDISKNMISNVVTRWYVGTEYQKDTKFKNNPQDWTKAKGGFQKKGFKISSNYSLAIVWIDFKYSKNKKFITKVYHGLGL